MSKIGKRIVVVGVSASGKSTFSKKLAEKTDLPVTFMDSIMWRPGWQYVGDDEVVKQLKAISEHPEWIVEGYIVKSARGFLFERADTILYLDYRPIVAVSRYIRRWWKHRTHPRPELGGSPEKFSFTFLKLIWTKGETISLNKFLVEMGDQSKVVKLHSPKEARSFLKDL